MPSVWSARGGLVYKGRYKAKYQSFVKLCFETLNIVWDDFWPQNRRTGKILILLDTQDLSVRQKLPKLDIAMFVICHGQLPFLAKSDLGNFWRTDSNNVKGLKMKIYTSLIFPLVSPPCKPPGGGALYRRPPESISLSQTIQLYVQTNISKARIDPRVLSYFGLD